MAWRAELEGTEPVVVLRLHGDLDLMVEVPMWRALEGACQISRHVLVDLGDVRLIDSTCLRLLVRAHRAAGANGGRLCLIAPSRFIRSVLSTMRLEQIFPIFLDSAAASEWLKGGGGQGTAPRSPATGEAGDRGALGRA